MNVQEYCVQRGGQDYAQLLRQYSEELITLADAAGLPCDCNDHFFWVVEHGARVAFTLSSAGLAAAAVRIQRHL